MQWGGVSQISFETWDIVASELKYQSQSHNVFEEVDDTVVKWETGLVQRGKKVLKTGPCRRFGRCLEIFFPRSPIRSLSARRPRLNEAQKSTA